MSGEDCLERDRDLEWRCMMTAKQEGMTQRQRQRQRQQQQISRCISASKHVSGENESDMSCIYVYMQCINVQIPVSSSHGLTSYATQHITMEEPAKKTHKNRRQHKNRRTTGGQGPPPRTTQEPPKRHPEPPKRRPRAAQPRLLPHLATPFRPRRV